MSLQQKSKPKRSPRRQVCCHYWRIEPADGATSKGVCRYCGQEKEFNNDITAYLDDGDGNHRDGCRPVRVIRRHVRGAPTCRKCGKPMTLDTWVGAGVGGGIKPFWYCRICGVKDMVWY